MSELERLQALKAYFHSKKNEALQEIDAIEAQVQASIEAL